MRREKTKKKLCTNSEIPVEEYDDTTSKSVLSDTSEDTQIKKIILKSFKRAANKQKEVIEPKCIACEGGDMPTDLHKCISCSKSVHLLDGCSTSVGDEEGCGEKRMCTSCEQNAVQEQPPENSIDDRDLPELQLKEKWTRRNAKPSKYLKPVPNWDLVQFNDKVKIGHLRNGNKSKKAFKVLGSRVALKNTCAVDSIIQMIAASYAYNQIYRTYVDSRNELIFTIAKMLATK